MGKSGKYLLTVIVGFLLLSCAKPDWVKWGEEFNQAVDEFLKQSVYLEPNNQEQENQLLKLQEKVFKMFNEAEKIESLLTEEEKKDFMALVQKSELAIYAIMVMQQQQMIQMQMLEQGLLTNTNGQDLEGLMSTME